MAVAAAGGRQISGLGRVEATPSQSSAQVANGTARCTARVGCFARGRDLWAWFTGDVTWWVRPVLGIGMVAEQMERSDSGRGIFGQDSG